MLAKSTLDGACAPWAPLACAVEIACNNVNAMLNHEGPDFKHQVQRSVGPLSALVLHVASHDAEGGLSIMWLPWRPGPSPRDTQVPSLRTSCLKPRSSCASQCPPGRCPQRGAGKQIWETAFARDENPVVPCPSNESWSWSLVTVSS